MTSAAFCTSNISSKVWEEPDDVLIVLSKESAVLPHVLFCPNIVMAELKQALSETLLDDYIKIHDNCDQARENRSYLHACKI